MVPASTDLGILNMIEFSFRVHGYGLLAALAVAAGMAVSTPASAQERSPTILAEPERAKLRGDRHILRINDDASVIPAHRIVSLPIVDGRMGERVRLDNGLELYFPFGRIIEAKSEFGKYRSAANGQAEPDPFYKLVASFDAALGPVCATTKDAMGPGSRIDMRLGPNKTVSMVRVQPAQSAAPDDEKVKVVTVSEFRWLKREPEAERLYSACNSAGPKPKILARE